MSMRLIVPTLLLMASTMAPAALGGPGDAPGGFGFAGLNPTPTTPQFFDSRDRVKVEVIPSSTVVSPGSDLTLAVIFEHDDGWHVHTNAPVIPPELGSAEDYTATSIEVESSDLLRLIPHTAWIQWPEPHEIQVGWGGPSIPYSVFEGRAVAFLPVTVPDDATPGQAILTVRPVFQVCDDRTCLMPTPEPPGLGEEPSKSWQDYGIKIPVEIKPLDQMSRGATFPSIFNTFNDQVFDDIESGAQAPQIAVTSVNFNAFGLEFGLDTDGSFGLLLLLLVAALGGFLLNLTPCVLPVIPIKIMAISSSAGNRGRTLLLGIAMCLGVVGFWVAIGLAIALITGFTASNQLFQYPAFTIAVGVIIAAMAIGMCGLFAVRLPASVYRVSPKHDTLVGSFLFGIMTAILSTPCTAPFMGAAMAWAATKPPAVTLITFAAIGVGMSLPYLILAAFPALTNRMPKAGPASELIKQVMGLLMLAAAAYFIGVGLSGMLAEPPRPPSRIYFWFVAAIMAAAGIWLVVKTWQLTARSAPDKEMEKHESTDLGLPRHALGWRTSMTALGGLVAAAAIAMAVTLTDKGPIDWIWYSPAAFEDALDEDRVVVLEFTAEWCLNCKALEKAVLATEAVSTALASADVAPIKVDLTGNNTEGNEMLHAVGRHQIPLLVVFAPDGTEVFKEDFYTADQVIDAINRARER